jgi:adsorption protein B
MIFALMAFIILTTVCVFVIDDIIVDLCAFIFRLGPKELTKEQLIDMHAADEKMIAIIIANWHEHEVIGKMIAGNLKSVEYKNYHFFLGVYPNDPETGTAVQNAAAAFKNVHPVCNSKDGPTSKGQMLNEIVREIFRKEAELGLTFDVFLMHDSEDIMHPLSLKMINSEIDRTDFLQIPIFSFDRPAQELVGSTYIDEFSEIHTKDLFVRERLGAPVPSAGTGTAIQRRLMLRLLEDQSGNFLRENSLTEDYVLGLSAHSKGFKTSFCCYYRKDESGHRDYIATREYFPKAFGTAIRQKARWIVGLAFQGWTQVPWRGSLAHKYFLYRDRKGPLNNFVAMCTTALTVYLIGFFIFKGRAPSFMFETWFRIESLIATIGMFDRLYHRIKAVVLVNGWKKCWLVPLRWPIGNYINFVATLSAVKRFSKSYFKNEDMKWGKTTHELPEGFGEEPLVAFRTESVADA